MTSSDDLAKHDAAAWWRTAIIEIRPGSISLRGYPIEELIGGAGFAETVWLMLRGEMPKSHQVRLMEAALVAAVDHGPHAPSIATARMAITCGVGLNNAVASGVNALGDVHGGAGQQCMELYAKVVECMSQGLSASEAAATVVAEARATGTHVPGFGHRFHAVDPRADRLLELVDAATAAGHVGGRFAAIGRALESALASGRTRRLPMNIDGATAVVFAELGFPPPLGRGLFILARSVGILAHAWEQSGQDERIKGPMPPAIGYRYEGPARRHLDSKSQS